MAMENIGLGGTLSFNAQPAISGMTSASGAATRFNQSTNQLGNAVVSAGSKVDSFGARFKGAASAIQSSAVNFAKSAQTLASAVRNLGIAGLPLTAIFGVAFKKAADFEQQMSAVGAVSNASAEEMALLTATAKKMGATTVFSATESGQAMEELARAGFSAQENVEGISGVMAAAAADSMPLADAATIIASTVRGMGLEAAQSGRVADVLAKASSRSATNISQLGEALTYSQAQAKIMGISLPELTTALGVMADSGIRASSGGTSLTNALVKLSKPSEAAIGYMKQYGIEVARTADGNMDLFKTMQSTSQGLSGITDKVKKAEVMTELFGIRGQKAFAAIETGLKSGKVGTLLGELKTQFDTGGAAAEMAARRLDNFKGQMTLLSSALEGLAIETAGMFLNMGADGLKEVVAGVSGVVEVLQILSTSTQKNDARLKKFSPTIVAIAEGMAEGFKLIIDGVKMAGDAIKNMIKSFTGSTSPKFIKTLAKWITVSLLVVAAIAPVMVALGGVAAFVLGILIPLIEGIGPVFLVVAGLAIGALNLMMGTFNLLRRDGESVGTTIKKVFLLIKAAILAVINGAIMPLVNAFLNIVRPAVEKMRVKVIAFTTQARQKFQELFSGIIQAVNRLMPIFKLVFRVLGGVVGNFVKHGIVAFGLLLESMKPVFKVIVAIAKFLVEHVMNEIINLIKLITKVADLTGNARFIPKEFRELAAGGRFQIDDKVTFEKAAGIDDKMFDFDLDISGELAKGKALEKGGSKTEVALNLQDDRQVNVENCVKLDGRSVARSTAKHKLELSERSGFRATPWQRRVIAEQGAAPVLKLGGAL